MTGSIRTVEEKHLALVQQTIFYANNVCSISLLIGCMLHLLEVYLSYLSGSRPIGNNTLRISMNTYVHVHF